MEEEKHFFQLSLQMLTACWSCVS